MPLRALLCHAPILAAPDFERSFKLDVDASGVGLGQDDNDGIEHHMKIH